MIRLFVLLSAFVCMTSAFAQEEESERNFQAGGGRLAVLPGLRHAIEDALEEDAAGAYWQAPKGPDGLYEPSGDQSVLILRSGKYCRTTETTATRARYTCYNRDGSEPRSLVWDFAETD